MSAFYAIIARIVLLVVSVEIVRLVGLVKIVPDVVGSLAALRRFPARMTAARMTYCFL
jgi:hypothetical protein